MSIEQLKALKPGALLEMLDKTQQAIGECKERKYEIDREQTDLEAAESKLVHVLKHVIPVHGTVWPQEDGTIKLVRLLTPGSINGVERTRIQIVDVETVQGLDEEYAEGAGFDTDPDGDVA